MAKGQKRSNRELKKPKKAKAPAAVAAPLPVRDLASMLKKKS
ncbi:MAG: hypothetical protein ACT60Q_28825 [Ferrovibrionaceae bacterium]